MTAPNLCRPPTINVHATTPGSATEAVSREVLSAWQMRTNYIEYHLRLQNQRPKQGKLFAEEYPEPSTPPALQEPSEPSEEYSFGSSQDEDLSSTSGTQATTVAQTIFNVVGLSLHSTVVCLLTPALHPPSPESLTCSCCRQICSLVWACCLLHMHSSLEDGWPCLGWQQMQRVLQLLVSTFAKIIRLALRASSLSVDCK